VSRLSALDMRVRRSKTKRRECTGREDHHCPSNTSTRSPAARSGTSPPLNVQVVGDFRHQPAFKTGGIVQVKPEENIGLVPARHVGPGSGSVLLFERGLSDALDELTVPIRDQVPPSDQPHSVEEVAGQRQILVQEKLVALVQRCHAASRLRFHLTLPRRRRNGCIHGRRRRAGEELSLRGEGRGHRRADPTEVPSVVFPPSSGACSCMIRNRAAAGALVRSAVLSHPLRSQNGPRCRHNCDPDQGVTATVATDLPPIGGGPSAAGALRGGHRRSTGIHPDDQPPARDSAFSHMRT
jgi:hypothetical protein